jgi:Cyclic nucleotide-binding domain
MNSAQKIYRANARSFRSTEALSINGDEIAYEDSIAEEAKDTVPRMVSSLNLMEAASLSNQELPNLPSELSSLLMSLPFFRSLTPGSGFLADISAHLRVRKYGAQDIVLKHGDEAKALFFVIKGVLSVTSEDREVEFAELEPGSFCSND